MGAGALRTTTKRHLTSGRRQRCHQPQTRQQQPPPVQHRSHPTMMISPLTNIHILSIKATHQINKCAASNCINVKLYTTKRMSVIG